MTGFYGKISPHSIQHCSMAIKLYHRTSEQSVQSILDNGFRNNTGFYGMTIPLTGVFFSNYPVDCNEGTKGDQLLEILLDVSVGDLFYKYEIIEEDKPFREFIIPAEFINANSTVRRVTFEEDCNIDSNSCWNEYPEGEPGKTCRTYGLGSARKNENGTAPRMTPNL